MSAALEYLSFAQTAPLLLDAAVKGAALLALSWLAVLLMRRTSAAARHMVWKLALVGLLVLPISTLVAPKWGVLPAWSGLSARPAAAAQARPGPSATTAEPSGAAARGAGTRAVSHTSIEEGETAPEQGAAGAKGFTALEISRGGGARARLSARAGAGEPGGRQSGGAAEGSPGSWRVWLSLVWMLGALAVLARLGAARVRLARLVKGARRVDAGWWLSHLAEVRRHLGVRRRVELLLTDDEVMPTVCGVLRPRILLPAGAGEWEEERRRAVLLHELAHVRRWDCLWQLVGQAAAALHWFDPLVWLAKGRMVAESERASDDMVLASGVGAGDYAEELLRAVRTCRRPGAATAGAIAMARPGRLEGRLRAVLDRTRSRGAPTLAAVLLSAVVALGAVFAVSILAAAGPGDEAAEEARAVAGEAAGSGDLAGGISGARRVTLSGGGEVELVAVSTSSEEQSRRWWRPDGQQIEPLGYRGASARAHGERVREFYVRLHGLRAGDRSTKISISDTPAGSAVGGVVDADGRRMENLYVGAAQVKDVDSVTIRVGVAAGEWTTVEAWNGKGVRATGYSEPAALTAPGAGGQGVIFGPAYETDGSAAVTVAHSIMNRDLRVVAVRADGARRTSVSESAAGAGNVAQISARFDGTPLESVDHFEFQERPYEWVEFRGVSIEAGHRTKLRAVSEPAGSGPARRGNEEPAEPEPEGPARTAAARGPSEEPMPGGRDVYSNHNLKQIGLALHMYVADYDAAPESLQTLHDGGYAPDAELFLSEASDPATFEKKRIDETGGFHYARAEDPAWLRSGREPEPGIVPSDFPVAWEKSAPPGRPKLEVLFADGHVESFAPDELTGRIRRLRRFYDDLPEGILADEEGAEASEAERAAAARRAAAMRARREAWRSNLSEDAPGHTRGTAEVSSPHNLKQIGLSVLMYAHEHDAAPAKLQVLYDGNYVPYSHTAEDKQNLFLSEAADPDGFDARNVDETGGFYYARVKDPAWLQGGADAEPGVSPHELPVAWEKKTPPGRERVYVLFGDGHVEGVPPAELGERIRNLLDVYEELPEGVLDDERGAGAPAPAPGGPREEGTSGSGDARELVALGAAPAMTAGGEKPAALAPSAPDVDEAAPAYTWGAVVERVVNDDGAGEDFCIDFDTGELHTPPREFEEAEFLKWAEQEGVDAFGETSTSVRGLVCLDMVVGPTSNRFDAMGPGSITGEPLLINGKPGSPVFMTAKGELPEVYRFKTREGGLGALEITGFTGDPRRIPRGIRIRYRLLRRPRVGVGEVIRAVLKPEDMKEGLVLDIETGRKIQRGEARSYFSWMRLAGQGHEDDIGFVTSRMQITGHRDEAGWAERLWRARSPDDLESFGARAREFGVSLPHLEPGWISGFRTPEGTVGVVRWTKIEGTDVHLEYKILSYAKSVYDGPPGGEGGAGGGGLAGAGGGRAAGDDGPAPAGGGESEDEGSGRNFRGVGGFGGAG